MSALRYLLDTGGTAVAYLRRHRRIDPRELVTKGPVKVNLGSGLEVASGWINVDASLHALIARWPRSLQSLLLGLSGYRDRIDRDEYLRRLDEHRFVHADLTGSLPFVAESTDYVFCSHFLEHLSRRQCLNLLVEAHRILRPGGTIRVAVPDLDLAIGLYAEGEAREMLDHYFYRPDAGRLAQHRYMYNFPLLAEILNEAGFTSIERCEYQKGTVPDLAQLDNRPEQTLFVEAAKPPRP